jgi:hypothetical protein
VSEQQNRDTLERYFQVFEQQDLDAMEELLHDDYVEEYPQSGERIRGKDNWRKIAENYPGLPNMTDHSYVLSGDLGVMKMTLEYDGNRVWEHGDAHDPAIRRTMAQTLAWLIDLACEVPDVQELDKGWRWPKKGRLWPEPHNALFDFEITAEGAEWIDEVAEEAKKIMDGCDGEVVVGHTDWSVDQMRFKSGEVSVVYDWDSVRPEKEVVVMGTAAATFTATWRFGAPNPPNPEETWAFVEEYEAARQSVFSGEERAAIAAASVYVMAYTARCEHALDPGGENLSGSFREVLRSHIEAYFRPGPSGEE